MSRWYSCNPKTSGITMMVANLPAFFGAAQYAGISPPGTGTFTSPVSRPSAGVLIACCAISGPAASAKPLAALETRKPRRENGTAGMRLSRSGWSNLLRSFMRSSG